MKQKTRKKLLWTSIITFLLVAPPVVLYTAGWRITKDFQIKLTGGVFVAVPESGSKMFVNGKERKTTRFYQSGVFLQTMTPDTYSVLVAKEGFWPWTKNLEVKESAVTEANALMLPQSISGKSILKGDFERIFSGKNSGTLLLEENREGTYSYRLYSPESDSFFNGTGIFSADPLRSLVWEKDEVKLFFGAKTIRISINESSETYASGLISEKLPADDSLPHLTVTDKRERLKVWLDKNTNEIWAKWTAESPVPYYLSGEKELVFKGRTEIKHVSLMPGRDDIVFIAIGNGVFALEIDSRGIRNFQPVYKGINPTFARLGDNIYVLDEGAVSKIEM